MARVLFPFSASTFGGSHASALLLMRELPRFGFEPVAVVLDKGPLQDRLAQAGIEHHCLDMPSYQSGQSLLSYLPDLMRIALTSTRVIRKLKVHIVHINDSRMANTWIPGARIAGCKIVLHQRTRFARSRFLEWNAERVDALIAISEYVKTTMPRGLGAKSEVVLNPIEKLQAPLKSDRKYAFLDSLVPQENQPKIGFFGTLSGQKRPEVFVQMAAKMRFHPQPVYLMFGRGSELQRKALQQMVDDLGLSDRFRIYGFSDHVFEAMSACDVVVAPAVNEGFGRVPIEAAFFGVPAVASASGGHLEAIIDGATGMLATPDDPQSFAAAVDALLANPACGRKLASAAKSRAELLFSVSSHAKSIVDIYRRVL